jgi:hypothetical protein
MNAGMPGTGMGGLFYMLVAACMPVREARTFTQGSSLRSHWRLVVRQVSMAVIIALTMWATGEVVGRVIAFTAWNDVVSINDAMNMDTVVSGQYNLVRLPFILWTLVAIAVLRLAMVAALLVTRASWYSDRAPSCCRRSTTPPPRPSVATGSA